MSAWNRRQLLKGAAGAGLLASVGDLSFLSGLRPVSAQEARVAPDPVRFAPEIEPLVRLLEETPRERVLEAAVAEIRRGTTYPQLLHALLLAGVRNIEPLPPGFKFHAVLVVYSTHQAVEASPPEERWLPLLWSLDYYKAQEATQLRQGEWTLAAANESALAPAGQARQRFVEAMDRWDPEAADAAVTQFARTASKEEVFDLFWRYGARDFRSIGHKPIYVATVWRGLNVVGWENAEPVYRSLVLALLSNGSRNGGIVRQEGEPDRPWKENLERVKGVRPDWKANRPDPAATVRLLGLLRTATDSEACAEVVRLLNRGAAARSLWEAVLAASGELLMRQPNITSLHAVTGTNALHYNSAAARDDETKLLILLQATAFNVMFRNSLRRLADRDLQRLEPLELSAPATSPAAVEEIFAEVSRDRLTAARKTLAYLKAGGSPEELMSVGRRLVFLKGRDSHDYKYSSAALEDYYHLSPEWRDLYLATAMFNLRGSGGQDTAVARRAREALSG